jgi:signal transduction histidine kinase
MNIFRRLSYQIAWRFTVMVILLLILVGAIYLSVEFYTLQRDATQRVVQRTRGLVNTIVASNSALSIGLLDPVDQARVRLLAPDGTPLFTGGFFVQGDIPFTSPSRALLSDILVGGQPYRMITTPLVRGTQLIGYLQVAEPQRVTPADIPQEAFLFGLVTLAISLITFYSGLRFARQSLVPVRESMERLEQFTQDASHELRTPLSTLGSSLDLALKTKEYKEGILSAKSDLTEAQQLIDRLLEIARLDSAHITKRRISLTKILEEVVERMQPLAQEKGLTLTAELKPKVMVLGDETLIRQLVGNLISNACKFTLADGSVSLHLKSGQLQIRDTGVGIASDQLPFIFDRFFQADSSRSEDGFGLGLAFVRKAVQLHGWSIVAESTVGSGTNFILTFPALKGS